ncbi:hypothetical protein I7I53_09929 [Histoplasma capsulatum var. duboisii H88]|uniref:Uncharacterized protein n=1 Tax=Ajellomyces capsulatus (strain H88) TaxID=544711 RepID=A0A8A1LA35_AJEC8|nr:hypothetical protein I7I53_09929 [Histoplasma capsulatum var. duboisii H88]
MTRRQINLPIEPQPTSKTPKLHTKSPRKDYSGDSHHNIARHFHLRFSDMAFCNCHGDR